MRRATSALLGTQDAEYSRDERQSDHDEAKAGAQAIYLAPIHAQAEAAFRRF
jgi:hypothetical protein